MKNIIMVCLVVAMMFMVGCTTRIENLDNIGKRFPNSEIFGMSDNQYYIIRTSSNEVFIAVALANGKIKDAKIFNARP